MRAQVILLLALFCASSYCLTLTVSKTLNLSGGRVAKVGVTTNAAGGIDCTVDEYANSAATTATTQEVLTSMAATKICTVVGAVLDDDENIWVALRTDAAAGVTLASSLVLASQFVTEQNLVLCLDKTTGAASFGNVLYGTYLASHNTAAGGAAGVGVTPGAFTISTIQFCDDQDVILVKGVAAYYPVQITSVGSGTQVFDTAFSPATAGTAWYTWTPNGAASTIKAKSATAPSCTSAGRLIVSSMLLVILALFI